MAHPYQGLPPEAYWRRAVAAPEFIEVDPISPPKFKISRTDRVATAGSCFAQHLSRRLSEAGFNYYVAEKPHPIMPLEVAAQFNYGVFTARYGNIYTTRQLLQLFDRAFGDFRPQEPAWIRQDSRWVDPFRPEISPDGFVSVEEMEFDRRNHLACVAEAFEQLDVFVFTLGLTECWMSKADGAVFPLCPGVSGGQFDSSKYQFHNQTVEEVVTDLEQFRSRILSVNSRARFILTTSPVPLIATASGRHVLTATTASKSILRVACDVLHRHDDVEYFPSYEIITGSFNRGRYFAEDLRSVTQEGVDHVMRLFLRHFADASSAPPATPSPTDEGEGAELVRLLNLVCEEEALDRANLAGGARRS